MTKYLKVITETPYDEITSYQELTDADLEAGEKHLEQIAADLFHNECNYGYDVVDESDVPEGERP